MTKNLYVDVDKLDVSPNAALVEVSDGEGPLGVFQIDGGSLGLGRTDTFP
jgi:hypothetical protein